MNSTVAEFGDQTKKNFTAISIQEVQFNFWHKFTFEFVNFKQILQIQSEREKKLKSIKKKNDSQKIFSVDLFYFN